ncbi:MAG: hypothetical protein ABW034_13105 [Steroidobacteraceae bacterium]
MDTLIGRLPEIITAAAQSYLGMLALLSVALSVLAYFFFATASEKVKVGIFVMLFLGALSFGIAMFRVSHDSPTPTRTALSHEAKTILKAVASDPSGLVLFERYGEGVDLHTNGVSLLTSKEDHHALASWESALQELVEGGLLVPRGERGEVFEITKQGYDAANRTANAKQTGQPRQYAQ